MAIFFYNIFLLLYKMGIRMVSMWNPKAKLWVAGRKNIFEKISNDFKPVDAPIAWFHCSSLGEFEQGRPVIEIFKSQHPDFKILLTFFSPSGYEIRKNYKEADWVYYFPMDSKANARKFLEIVKPSLVVFVKYDYWYYYLHECKQRKIPLYIVSAIFRKGQPFFKWYGGLHRKMLQCFTHLFVQDKESASLLNSIGVKNITVTGDTRFDRVIEIANNFTPIAEIEKFCRHSKVLVAGSTWPSDEKIIKEATCDSPDFSDLKIIIAPHEIHKEHLDQLKQLFPQATSYSQLTTQYSPSNILIINNIGMLSRLYHYATITYIGGGFDKGIHNTLEAAVYGKPVLFGPNYKKFKEAIGLIETGGGITINSAVELRSTIKDLLSDQNKLQEKSKRSFDFVQQNKGATETIIKVIHENLRLTK